LSEHIRRTDPVEYRINLDGRVDAFQQPHRIDPNNLYEMELENAPIVFPVIPDGSYHTINLDRLKTTLELDDIPTQSQFEILQASTLESRLGRFLIRKFKGKEVEFMLEEYVTCYNSVINEEELRKITWIDQWPPEIQDALQPQLYIETTSESVARLVEKWTKGKAKEVPPFLLGKELARRVVESYQINGKDIYNDRLGRMAGFEVRGAVKAINEPRGPATDVVCLFVAACRAAGLPARPVIGIDFHEGEREDKKEWCYWAEFYVPTAGWIPVDFRELYAAPGMMRDINRAWKGLGTNDRLNELVPIAYHFHPPAHVRAEGTAGKPMLWGWQPRPRVVPCDQSLSYRITIAPKGGGN
jgi:hypothetical protein